MLFWPWLGRRLFIPYINSFEYSSMHLVFLGRCELRPSAMSFDRRSVRSRWRSFCIGWEIRSSRYTIRLFWFGFFCCCCWCVVLSSSVSEAEHRVRRPHECSILWILSILRCIIVVASFGIYSLLGCIFNSWMTYTLVFICVRRAGEIVLTCRLRLVQRHALIIFNGHFAYVAGKCAASSLIRFHFWCIQLRVRRYRAGERMSRRNGTWKMFICLKGCCRYTHNTRSAFWTTIKRNMQHGAWSSTWHILIFMLAKPKPMHKLKDRSFGAHKMHARARDTLPIQQPWHRKLAVSRAVYQTPKLQPEPPACNAIHTADTQSHVQIQCALGVPSVRTLWAQWEMAQIYLPGLIQDLWIIHWYIIYIWNEINVTRLGTQRWPCGRRRRRRR